MFLSGISGTLTSGNVAQEDEDSGKPSRNRRALSAVHGDQLEYSR